MKINANKIRTIQFPDQATIDMIDRRTDPHLRDMIASDGTLRWLARVCYAQACEDVIQLMVDMPGRVKDLVNAS